MSQGIWRICLFHPRFCQIWDKSGKRFHVGMAEWLFLRSPSSIFRWELWDWDRSGAKMFQLFNTDFPNLFPLLLVSFFQEKKKTQKMGKNREKKSQTENCHCGILPWRGNVWEWWRRGVGHKIGNKSWVYSCCWIPFGILDSLRSLGSPLGFLNS